MDLATVQAGMSEIFSDLFEHNIGVSPELTAKDVEGWDSFRQVEIIMAVEEKFHLKFTSKEIDGFATLGDLMRVVLRRAKSPS